MEGVFNLYSVWTFWFIFSSFCNYVEQQTSNDARLLSINTGVFFQTDSVLAANLFPAGQATEIFVFIYLFTYLLQTDLREMSNIEMDPADSI